MTLHRLSFAGVLLGLSLGAFLLLPQGVEAAAQSTGLACTGACIPNALPCASAFPLTDVNSSCPKTDEKCCIKNDGALTTGGGTASQTCANATGGICVGKDQACPTGKTDVDAQFPCKNLVQKCCANSTGAGGGAGSTTKLSDPLGGVGLYGILRRVISAVLGIVGAVALLVFFASGVMYMVGGETYVTTAKAAMVNAVIGLLIIFFAYSISNWFFLALTSNPM